MSRVIILPNEEQLCHWSGNILYGLSGCKANVKYKSVIFAEVEGFLSVDVELFRKPRKKINIDGHLHSI